MHFRRRKQKKYGIVLCQFFYAPETISTIMNVTAYLYLHCWMGPKVKTRVNARWFCIRNAKCSAAIWESEFPSCLFLLLLLLLLCTHWIARFAFKLFFTISWHFFLFHDKNQAIKLMEKCITIFIAYALQVLAKRAWLHPDEHACTHTMCLCLNCVMCMCGMFYHLSRVCLRLVLVWEKKEEINKWVTYFLIAHRFNDVWCDVYHFPYFSHYIFKSDAFIWRNILARFEAKSETL